MLTADCAEHSLAFLRNNIAEVFAAEERTSFALGQNESFLFKVDVLSESFAQRSFHTFVYIQGVHVNADFPADTTVVTALVSNTFEIVIIVGAYLQHKITSQQSDVSNSITQILLITNGELTESRPIYILLYSAKSQT